MARHLRLKKLISWTVQGPIATWLLVHFFSYNAAVVSLLLVVYTVRCSLAAVSETPVSVEPITFWQQAAPVIIAMVVMMPFMIWDLMRLTNRIAGPLFRFEALLKEFIQTGKLKPAALRDGDFLTNFQRQFNEFTETLHALYPETRPVVAAAAAESAGTDSKPTGMAFHQAN